MPVKSKLINQEQRDGWIMTMGLKSIDIDDG